MLFEQSPASPHARGSNYLLKKHHGIAQRLLVEHQAHCATLAAACRVKFQAVLSWLQKKPKDIEEVSLSVLQHDT